MQFSSSKELKAQIFHLFFVLQNNSKFGRNFDKNSCGSSLSDYAWEHVVWHRIKFLHGKTSPTKIGTNKMSSSVTYSCIVGAHICTHASMNVNKYTHSHASRHIILFTCTLQFMIGWMHKCMLQIFFWKCFQSIAINCFGMYNNKQDKHWL